MAYEIIYLFWSNKSIKRSNIIELLLFIRILNIDWLTLIDSLF